MEWGNLLTLGFLNGLGTVGTWTLLGILLITDKGLALKREVTQRDSTIQWQRQTIEELNSQKMELILGTRVSAIALDKVAEAAVTVGGEDT